MINEYLIPALFGLIGVAVGGLVSFGTQFYFLKREERRIRQQRVLSILFKLKMICDDVYTVSQSIRKSLPAEPKGQLWGHIRSVIGVDLRHIDFSPEELACLKSEKRVKIQDFLQITSSRRHAINAIMQEYSNLKQKHDANSIGLTEVNPSNPYQKISFNTREHPEVVMDVMQLNSMAFEIIDMLNEFFASLKSHQEDFTFVARETMGTNKVSFELPDLELEINVNGYSKSITDYATNSSSE